MPFYCQASSRVVVVGVKKKAIYKAEGGCVLLTHVESVSQQRVGSEREREREVTRASQHREGEKGGKRERERERYR